MASMQDDYDVSWGSLRPILQDLADRLARIEQYLADSGRPAGGVSDAVPGPFSSTPTDSPGRIAAAARGIDVGATPSQGSGIPDYIVQLAMSGKKIQAVKELRSFSGMDLKAAKAIIDQVAVGGY